MRELDAGDDVAQGATIHIHDDGDVIEGEVDRCDHGGDKLIIDGDDGNSYALFVPQWSYEGFDVRRRLDEGTHEVVTEDADKVEVRA